MAERLKKITSYSMFEDIYEGVICFLAIISVIFAILDLNNRMTPSIAMADHVAYGIFIVDYFVRLIFSESKSYFIRHNLWDLLAIFPFSLAIQFLGILHILDFAGLVNVAKASRFLRVTRLFRLTRLVTLLGRLFKKSGSFLNTNGFKYLLYFSLLFIITGGGLLAYFEGMPILDGIWCAFVTLATVGYGDIAPSTTGGRAIAIILMLFGVGLIGSLTSTITSYYLRSKKDEVVSNDRVDMVEKMYNELNDAEKEIFRKKIEQDVKE